MLTNDEEPSIEPVRGIRRRKVIAHGSQCRYCGSIARPRTVTTYPDGKPHPYPYRHCKCRNDLCRQFVETGVRHTWNSTIPSAQLLTSTDGGPNS